MMAPDTLKDGQRHHQSVAAAGSDGLSVRQSTRRQSSPEERRPPRPCDIGHQFRRRWRHRHNNNNLLLLFSIFSMICSWRRLPGGGSRPDSTCSGQRPPVLLSVSSRPSSQQSVSSTPRPPSVSPAFSPASNSVLGGCVHPSPGLSPCGGSTCLATTAGTSSSSSPSAGQQQPSPASMTTPYSNNFPFSPPRDLIPPMPAASTPINNNNPGTPFLDDMRDSKERHRIL